MKSAAYRRSATADPLALELDPANRLWWRFDMRRLAAEELRDSVIALGTGLNFEMGGPGFFSHVPPAALATSSTPNSVWGKSPPDQMRRRSVYIKVKRSLITPLLQSFDLADTDSSCAVRFITTQPTQALGLLNGEFSQVHARSFAERVTKEAGPKRRDRVALAMRLAFGRRPRAPELTEAVEFLSDLRRDFGQSEEEALTSLCLAILNMNEFVYLD